MKEEETKKIVREGYAKIAKQSSCCCKPVTSCCGGTDLAQDISKSRGYTEEDLAAVPEGANLGLGCGNPVALASLREGDTVLVEGAIDQNDLSAAPRVEYVARFTLEERVGDDQRAVALPLDLRTPVACAGELAVVDDDLVSVHIRAGE